MTEFSHTVPADPPQQRIDRYAATIFEAIASRSQARKLIKAGHLTLDGLPCSSARFVQAGHVLQLKLPTPAEPVLALDLPVVYVDPWLAVIDKPPGIHVRGNHPRTVRRALRHVLEPSDCPDALTQPEPVHRLDRRTSGLVLVARSARSRMALGQALEERRVHKRYRALLHGRLEGSGEIDQALEGRPAITRWRTVSHTRSLHTEWLSTVDLFPITGRTHQLRRHMCSLGHPVLGDDLYHHGPFLKGAGLFLSALELRLAHPITGEDLKVTRAERLKFSRHRQREERRWQRWAERGKPTP